MRANIFPMFIPQADMPEEESAIDEMVYQLYGLNEDAVKIVEGK